MQAQVLRAFQTVDSQATMDDVLEACRQLFIESDKYCHQLEQPFHPSEVDAVAKGICEYIENPDDPALREITFSVSRPLVGRAIEYCEFASVFSDDMLYQNLSRKFASLSTDGLRLALKRFLVAIFFRYQFCVSEDRAAFPVSMILDYMDAVRILFSREQREDKLSDALWTTLRAIGSLEAQRWVS